MQPSVCLLSSPEWLPAITHIQNGSRDFSSKLCTRLGWIYSGFTAVGMDLLVRERKRKNFDGDFSRITASVSDSFSFLVKAR